MRTAHTAGPSTATDPAPPHERRGRRGRDRGLVTLEWLLIVAAVAGLAGSSVLIVQQVLDEHSEVPDDPLVRLLEADIAAAFIADEANEAVLSGPYADAAFERRCEVLLPPDFDDVVASAYWRSPATVPPTQTLSPPDPPNPPELAAHAECRVTPRSGLGNG